LVLVVPNEADKICNIFFGNNYKDNYNIHPLDYDIFLSNIYDGIVILTIVGKKILY
jgi:hypothetical protein